MTNESVPDETSEPADPAAHRDTAPEGQHDDRPAMEGGDRERGDRGIGADEAGIRSHALSEGEYGPTSDYGDG